MKSGFSGFFVEMGRFIIDRLGGSENLDRESVWTVRYRNIVVGRAGKRLFIDNRFNQ